jgi:hypothetical protein
MGHNQRLLFAMSMVTALAAPSAHAADTRQPVRATPAKKMAGPHGTALAVGKQRTLVQQRMKALGFHVGAVKHLGGNRWQVKVIGWDPGDTSPPYRKAIGWDPGDISHRRTGSKWDPTDISSVRGELVVTVEGTNTVAIPRAGLQRMKLRPGSRVPKELLIR